MFPKHLRCQQQKCQAKKTLYFSQYFWLLKSLQPKNDDLFNIQFI